MKKMVKKTWPSLLLSDFSPMKNRNKFNNKDTLLKSISV